MANIQINIVENGTTTLATSGCICDRNIDINVAVPETGGGGYEIPESAFEIRGGCEKYFFNDYWSWFVELYGDKITTVSLLNSASMFQQCSNLENISFDFNFADSYTPMDMMFMQCFNLKEIGDLNNIHPNSMDNFFGYCRKLRYLPNFNNPDFSYLQTYVYGTANGMFQQCFSLREIPESFMKQFYNPNITSAYNTHFYSLFTNCYALDEIRGLSPITGTIPTNMFGDTFKNCNRLKEIIFVVQEDGTPYTANWTNQTIDLSSNIGYAPNTTNILNYNSGITADKQVTDDTTYQALKNDPDWFTLDVAYSRYNHDSAVNTINSLPDVSASGGTNTIKFNGASGSATDGGAINTLTEEEIAVATAKGWTVTIV